METGAEMRLWAEQIYNICRALPSYQEMGSRFSDLVEDSVKDLFVTLKDAAAHYCQVCLRSADPRSASPNPEALARYLFLHPERCRETLAALNFLDRDHRFWGELCA